MSNVRLFYFSLFLNLRRFSPSQNISIAGLTKPAVVAPKPTASPQTPAAQPSTLFDQKPTASSSPLLAAPSKPTSSLFGETPSSVPSTISDTSAPPTATTPKTALFSSAASLSQAVPATPVTVPAVSTSSATPVQPPKTPVEGESAPPDPVTPPEVKRAEQLALKKKAFIEKMHKTNATMASTKDAVMKMSFAVGNAKTSIQECAEVVQASLEDSKEVTDELKNLISSIEWMSERTKHTIKEMDFEIEEKMDFVSNEDDGERILEKLRDMSENEKMMRFNKLETAADMLNGKFAECTEQIRKLRMSLTERVRI